MMGDIDISNGGEFAIETAMSLVALENQKTLQFFLNKKVSRARTN